MNQMPNCASCQRFYKLSRETLVRLAEEAAQEEKTKSTRKIEYGDRVMFTREVTRGDIISALVQIYHKNNHSLNLFLKEFEDNV